MLPGSPEANASVRLRFFIGVGMTVGRVLRGSSRRRLKSASIVTGVAVSSRPVLPGTRPKNALSSERNQVRINLPSICLAAYLIGMSKMYRAVVAAFTAALIASAAQADGQNTSAQGLLSAWKGEDPNMRLIAEVIASARSQAAFLGRGR
jgi:hypothetical protein